MTNRATYRAGQIGLRPSALVFYRVLRIGSEMAEAGDGGVGCLRDQRSSSVRHFRPARLVVAWTVLAGVLIGAGELVVHSGAVQGFDNHVTSFVVGHRSAGLNAAMKAVTWLGSWVALLVAAGLVLLLVLRRRLPVGFLLLATVAWAGNQGGTTLAKSVVQRPRPPEDLWLVSAHGWSWPSGHTATATLVFAVLAAVVWMLTPRTRLRFLAVVGWIFVSAAMAFSRVELGVHWTTDVLGSLVFTTAWLVAIGTSFGDVVARATPHSGEQVAA
jgi:undecaprenyl-diphosphatase